MIGSIDKAFLNGFHAMASLIAFSWAATQDQQMLAWFLLYITCFFVASAVFSTYQAGVEKTERAKKRKKKGQTK